MGKNKLILPVSILLGAIVLGGFLYASQVSKQRSIEKQNQLELESKGEQYKIEYIAKQKTACLNIYMTESKKWDNVHSWNYNIDTDKCQIIYNKLVIKTEAQCNKEQEELNARGDQTSMSKRVADYFECLDPTFTREF